MNDIEWHETIKTSWGLVPPRMAFCHDPVNCSSTCAETRKNKHKNYSTHMYTQRYEYMNHIEKNQSLTCANYPEPQGMQIFWAPGSSPKSKKSSFIAKSQGGWDLKTSGHEYSTPSTHAKCKKNGKMKLKKKFLSMRHATLPKNSLGICKSSHPR